MIYAHLATVTLSTLLLAASAGTALAHSAGALDINGCHSDKRLGQYHCHLGDYKGKHYDSRADFIKMKQTGEDTTTKAQRPGRFGDLTNSLGVEEPADKADAPAAERSVAAGAGPGPAARPSHHHHGSAAGGRSIEDRLKTLKRLYEKDLITKGEYDDKRRALLDDL